MNNSDLAKSIIKLSGGEENIIKAIHCITRIRFNLKDDSKADSKAIENLEGVIGTTFKSGQFQIIIGNNVNNVFAEVEKILNLEPKNSEIKDNEKPNELKEGKKEKGIKNIGSLVLDTISSSFQPILPAIIGAGMMKGILALFVVAGWVADTSGTYKILSIIADASFYFLPFLLAVSVSRKFNVNEFLGIVVAGSLMYPTIIDAAKAGHLEPIRFLSIPVPIVNYSATVFPIILGIILMSYIYKAIDRFIAKSLKLVLTPTITLLITVPIVLTLVAPLGNYLGNYLAVGMNWLFEHAGFLAGLLIGFFNPIIVMTGMHYGMFPIMIQNFGTFGFDAGYLPVNLVTNLAQAGSVFAVALRTRNKTLKSVAVSSGISALLGTTEPAMFGVNLKLKKPFYAAMIAGGISASIVIAFGLKTFGFVIPGLIALPTYISPDGALKNFLLALLGIMLSFIVSFILTLVLGFEDIDIAKKEI